MFAIIIILVESLKVVYHNMLLWYYNLDLLQKLHIKEKHMLMFL